MMPRKRLPAVLALALLLSAALSLGAASVSSAAEDGPEVAPLAGGCFWRVEAGFDAVPGKG